MDPNAGTLASGNELLSALADVETTKMPQTELREDPIFRQQIVLGWRFEALGHHTTASHCYASALCDFSDILEQLEKDRESKYYKLLCKLQDMVKKRRNILLRGATEKHTVRFSTEPEVDVSTGAKTVRMLLNRGNRPSVINQPWVPLAEGGEPALSAVSDTNDGLLWHVMSGMGINSVPDPSIKSETTARSLMSRGRVAERVAGQFTPYTLRRREGSIISTILKSISYADSVETSTEKLSVDSGDTFATQMAILNRVLAKMDHSPSSILNTHAALRATMVAARREGPNVEDFAEKIEHVLAFVKSRIGGYRRVFGQARGGSQESRQAMAAIIGLAKCALEAGSECPMDVTTVPKLLTGILKHAAHVHYQKALSQASEEISISSDLDPTSVTLGISAVQLYVAIDILARGLRDDASEFSLIFKRSGVDLLNVLCNEFMVLLLNDGKALCHAVLKAPPSAATIASYVDLFELSAKLIETHAAYSDYATLPPLNLEFLHEVIVRWMSDTSRQLFVWVNEACTLDDWTPVSDTCMVSSSVVDVFCMCFHPLKVLRDVEVMLIGDSTKDEPSEATLPFSHVFVRIIMQVVLNYGREVIRVMRKKFVSLCGIDWIETDEMFQSSDNKLASKFKKHIRQFSSAIDDLLTPGAMNDRELVEPTDRSTFVRLCIVLLNNLVSARRQLSDVFEIEDVAVVFDINSVREGYISASRGLKNLLVEGSAGFARWIASTSKITAAEASLPFSSLPGLDSLMYSIDSALGQMCKYEPSYEALIAILGQLWAVVTERIYDAILEPNRGSHMPILRSAEQANALQSDLDGLVDWYVHGKLYHSQYRFKMDGDGLPRSALDRRGGFIRTILELHASVDDSLLKEIHGTLVEFEKNQNIVVESGRSFKLNSEHLNSIIRIRSQWRSIH